MALEDRLAFREALLEHQPEQEWKHYRPQHQSVYHGRFPFEGREVTGAELIREYAQRFPADREYSDRGQLNRMLADCDIPQFSFTDQDVIRGFLLSARTPAQWNKYQPSYHTFWELDFKHMGIDLKGQMLLATPLESDQNIRPNNTPWVIYAEVDKNKLYYAEPHQRLRPFYRGQPVFTINDRLKGGALLKISTDLMARRGGRYDRDFLEELSRAWEAYIIGTETDDTSVGGYVSHIVSQRRVRLLSKNPGKLAGLPEVTVTNDGITPTQT